MSKSKRVRKHEELVSLIGQLIRVIGEATQEDLEIVGAKLQEFNDAWVVSGETANWPGVKECCLADVDITEQLREAINIRLESYE